MTIERDEETHPGTSRRRHPPAFNVPGVVLAAIIVFAVVHILRTYVAGPMGDARILLDFAFIPGCYAAAADRLCDLRDAGAGIWSPLTHAFLHGDWTHFGANAVWLLAFGTPVARRVGTARFLVFSAFGAVAGAGLFYLMNPDLVEPVIGASGVVSALMGGACRFAFSGPGGPIGSQFRHQPLLPIGRALADKTVLIFIIVFFATNLAIGSGFGGAFGAAGEVAWEAHLGGFLFGFLLFGFFDRPARMA